jgi:hypothetical protein
MKFKVTAKTRDTVSVTFDDGSHAVVPVFKGQTKEQIIEAVSGYNNDPFFDNASDVPVNVDDELEVPTAVDETVDYRYARKQHYPDIGRQLDALYWAREGDDTQGKKLDAEIKLVKDTIPKSGTYKMSEISKLMD